MVKQAVAARTTELDPIDRLDEKVRRLVETLGQLRTEQTRAADENARLLQEIDTLRARLSDAEAVSTELTALRDSKKLSIIDARLQKPGSFGHNYFYANPAVSSDVILLLRHQLPPGAEHGRPLHASPNGFWYIDDKYPGPTTLPAEVQDSAPHETSAAAEAAVCGAR